MYLHLNPLTSQYLNLYITNLLLLVLVLPVDRHRHSLPVNIVTLDNHVSSVKTKYIF